MSTHETTIPQNLNGRARLPLTGISDLSYTDTLVNEMPGISRANQDERIADILEGIHTLTLEIRASGMVSQQQKDKTSLPNWLMPLICTAFIALVVYAFTTVVQNLEKGNDKLERRLDTQETYMKNTREQLIAHGWTIDDQGNVHAPPAKK